MNIDLNKWSPATVMVIIGFVFLLIYLPVIVGGIIWFFCYLFG